MQDWEARHRAAADHVVPFLLRTAGLQDARVLEFGAGNGAIACAVAPHARELLGLDILEGDIGEARRHAADAGHRHLRFESGPFETLLERARENGRIDVFLLHAVLEHMTLPERLTTLRLAKELLAPGGSVCVFETPNRLLWWDHHTAALPFFGMLPDELALSYFDRSPRGEFVNALEDSDGERELTLARWGRGASQHEFELVFGDLGDQVRAGGYDPDLLPLRHVHREELALARFMRGLPAPPNPVFSRYWLDLVLMPDGRGEAPGLVDPWPLSTLGGHRVGFTPWETIRFDEPGSRFDVPRGAARALLVGIEVGSESAGVDVRAGETLLRRIEAPPRDASTLYVEVALPPGCDHVTLEATLPGEISFVGLRRP